MSADLHEFDEEVKRRIREMHQQRTYSEVRRSKSMSQTEVAASMGTSSSVVSRLENGADVNVSTLQKYAAALGCVLRIEIVPKVR